MSAVTFDFRHARSRNSRSSPSRALRTRLTENRILQLPTPASAPTYTYDADVPGLALRVTANAVRTFVVVKKIAGRTHRLTLGRWPGLRLAEARRAATKMLGDIAAGRDPAAERKAARARAETCNDFWGTYLAHIKRQNASWKRDEERWTKDIAPRMGRRPLVDASTAECQRLVDDLGASYPVKANRVVALMSAFFGHAMRQGRIDRNPVRGMSRYPETPRERFMRAEEIERFLRACRDAPDPWRDLFALLLWTGARKSAVMGMRWADLDLKDSVWHLRAETSKNRKSAALPLVPQAMEILVRRQTECGSAGWVFPSRSASGHVTHLAKAWRNMSKSAGLSDVRPHDLRRTIGSWLAASGANAFVIQKALTHKSAASAKAYAHLDVDPVRAALERVTNAMSAQDVG